MANNYKFEPENVQTDMMTLEGYFTDFADTLKKLNDYIETIINAGADSAILGLYGAKLFEIWDANAATFGDFHANFSAWSEAVAVISANNTNFEVNTISAYLNSNGATAIDSFVDKGSTLDGVADARTFVSEYGRDGDTSNLSADAQTVMGNASTTQEGLIKDGEFFISTSVDASGNTVEIKTDAEGKVVRKTVTDQNGTVIEKMYTNNNGTYTIEKYNADGKQTSYVQYGEDGSVLKENTYYEDGSLKTSTEYNDDGSYKVTEYDSSGKEISSQDYNSDGSLKTSGGDESNPPEGDSVVLNSGDTVKIGNSEVRYYGSFPTVDGQSVEVYYDANGSMYYEQNGALVEAEMARTNFSGSEAERVAANVDQLGTIAKTTTHHGQTYNSEWRLVDVNSGKLISDSAIVNSVEYIDGSSAPEVIAEATPYDSVNKNDGTVVRESVPRTSYLMASQGNISEINGVKVGVPTSMDQLNKYVEEGCSVIRLDYNVEWDPSSDVTGYDFYGGDGSPVYLKLSEDGKSMIMCDEYGNATSVTREFSLDGFNTTAGKWDK